MLNEVQEFWAGLRMAVMNRQPGLTWEDTGKMPITYFFHVLKLSEKNSGESDTERRLSRSEKRQKNG